MECKGCVYFFRHIGLTPVKIGYSTSESPIERFQQFKTYAPYGAELLGFIVCEDAKKLETELHRKYSRDRLTGEWFELTTEEVQRCISFYSNIIDIEKKNEFEIAWAKRRMPMVGKTIDDNVKTILENYSTEFRDGYFEIKKTTKEISEELRIEINELRKAMRALGLRAKVFKRKNKTCSGYTLYK